MPNIIFVHGLESSGQGYKGRFFQNVFPGCLTPDFKEYIPGISTNVLLKERMSQLISILAEKEKWVIIGSSFGGAMAALYALKFPDKVAQLILLAPALAKLKFPPVDIPVVIYHGKKDLIVPMKSSRFRARQIFTNLTYNIVDDDHMLHHTVEGIDWKKLININ